MHCLIAVIRIRADGYGPNSRSKGDDPTSAIVSETVSDGISITVTVVSLPLHTYSFISSGLARIVQGWCPVGSVAMTVCVAVSMAETVSENPFCTKAFVPSRVITTLWQWIPVGMVAITVNVVVSMTETVPSCDVGHVNLLAIGGNGISHRSLSNRNGRDHLLRRRVDGGYGVDPLLVT